MQVGGAYAVPARVTVATDLHAHAAADKRPLARAAGCERRSGVQKICPRALALAGGKRRAPRVRHGCRASSGKAGGWPARRREESYRCERLFTGLLQQRVQRGEQLRGLPAGAPPAADGCVRDAPGSGQGPAVGARLGADGGAHTATRCRAGRPVSQLPSRPFRGTAFPSSAEPRRRKVHTNIPCMTSGDGIATIHAPRNGPATPACIDVPDMPDSPRGRLVGSRTLVRPPFPTRSAASRCCTWQ